MAGDLTNTQSWVKTFLFLTADTDRDDEDMREQYPATWAPGKAVKVVWGDEEISVMKVCEGCGALVADDLKHQEWHSIMRGAILEAATDYVDQ